MTRGRAAAGAATAAALACALAAAGCAGGVGFEPGLDDVAIRSVAPATIVPGTQLVVRADSFVDDVWGAAMLHLQGMAGDRAIDATWPAHVVDAATLVVTIDASRLAEIAPADDGADFHGSATLEVAAASDGAIYRSAPLAVDLSFRTELTPRVATIDTGVIFVNDSIAIEGDGFLLGGGEGTTVARLEGCFTPEPGVASQPGVASEPGACPPTPPVEVPLTASMPLSRTQASFAFSPRIAGIAPGSFTGTVTVMNRQRAAAPIAVHYNLVAPEVFALDPPAASLGQFVSVRGGGFVGGEPGSYTELALSGTLRKAGGAAVPIELTWIPELVDGRRVRYVLTTDDALGRALDLRNDTGELAGTITPIVSDGGARVRGRPRAVSFAVAPVKQIVFLDFEPSFTEGLRDFGLRGVDRQIRERILAVVREAYQGVNIELRTEPPTDFALFETVEMVGFDPNDQGLFGYDNSPGKDSGNLRLYDRLGGVNAQVQDDGYPGYGGVFVRSLMGFSMHPAQLTRQVAGADPAFDQIFDPFRPDRGGEPVRSIDLADGHAGGPLVDGAGCPASDRAQQIRCAVFVLGNLVGGTVAHEVGHSLGLANPYQDGFHDPGDAPDRLMDAGEARPFLERAQLMGQGPAVFCDEEYAYLRRILPSPAPASAVARPSCR